VDIGPSLQWASIEGVGARENHKVVNMLKKLLLQFIGNGKEDGKNGSKMS
jgi:hypothetical protein